MSADKTRDKTRRVSVADLVGKIDRKPPFEVEMSNGDVFRLRDPKSLPLKEQIKISEETATAESALRTLLGDDEWEKFANNPEADVYVFEAIMEDYNTHFGVAGESDASSPS